MRLLVLGGTRFLSRATAVEAVRRGHEVTCACRGSSPVPEGARHLALDREQDDVGAVLGQVRGQEPPYDAVVDVARRPSWVRAAVGALPDAHWVFVSSISVYADHGTPGGGPGRLPLLEPVPEDRDLAVEPEAYGGMKVACEELVQRGASSATLVRPGLIVGPGDPTGRFTYWVERLVEAGPVLAPGSPTDPTQVVDVRDLADWLVACAEQRLTGTFDAIGPVVPRSSLLAEVSTGVGSRPQLRWVPSERLVDLEVAEWAGPRSLPLWLASIEYAGMLAHDPAPAEEAGLRHRSLAETAADTLAWLRATPDATRTGLTRAEETEVLTRAAAGRS